MRNRRRYLHWFFEAKKRLGLCVIDYTQKISFNRFTQFKPFKSFNRCAPFESFNH
jgi:hypothetical protein